MFDEVGRDLVEPLVGGDDLVILAEKLIEQRGLIRVKFGLLDLRRDPVIQVGACHAEFLAPVFVYKLDGRAVLFRALEVVAGDVVAEDAPGDLVLLEQRRSGKADEGSVRQGKAHAAREPPGLRPEEDGATVKLVYEN